jgi:multidrug efflux pump subunit AcrB
MCKSLGHSRTARGFGLTRISVVSVAIVLTAVFVPTALISGISGQFYRQFALTIAIATLISAFNSLTLSPALAALLIKPGHAKKDVLSRLIETSLGWFSVYSTGLSIGVSRFMAVSLSACCGSASWS